jgi:hypothetical protein
MPEPAETAEHRAAVAELLAREEAEKDRDKDANLATAVEVLDDIRTLIGMGIELRDQLAVLCRREGPAFLDKLAKHLGRTQDEILDAVIAARQEARIDLDKYKLQHSPRVVAEMAERFNIEVRPGED